MTAALAMKKKILLALVLALVAWVAFDLLVPRKNSLRQFDPVAVGKLDADMWRSYYEKRKLRLFWQLAKLQREQFNAPFWRSFPMAYKATKAAFVFKDGKNRTDYAKALPYLEKYYTAINHLNSEPFDVAEISKMELEWWIIRREPAQFTTADWERILAEEAGKMYHQPANLFADYARLRTEAMVLRDEKGKNITEGDWLKINEILIRCWNSLHEAAQI